MPNDQNIGQLEATIGYQFNNLEHLKLALTHSSLSRHTQSNERIEFFGDKILGFIIAEKLYNRFPNEDEGKLTKRQAGLVCGESLGRIAANLGLGDFIEMSRAEEEAGGRHNNATLENTFEALVGAIYTDGGIEPTKEFILRIFDKEIEEMKKVPKDPKSTLQEFTQACDLGLPIYKVEEQSGKSHAPMFTISVEVEGLPKILASGKSKKEAEREGAKLMLEAIRQKA